VGGALGPRSAAASVTFPSTTEERRQMLAAAHKYAMHSSTRAETCSHLPWQSPSCARSVLQKAFPSSRPIMRAGSSRVSSQVASVSPWSSVPMAGRRRTRWFRCLSKAATRGTDVQKARLRHCGHTRHAASSAHRARQGEHSRHVLLEPHERILCGRAWVAAGHDKLNRYEGAPDNVHPYDSKSSFGMN